MAEQAIYALLTGVAALGDRVYPLVLPQNGEYPAATYQRIGATRYSAFRTDAEPVEATIQVDVYATRVGGFGAFSTLTEAVRAVLQRQATGNVIDMYLEAERDDFEDDTELFRKSYDVRAWYRET